MMARTYNRFNLVRVRVVGLVGVGVLGLFAAEMGYAQGEEALYPVSKAKEGFTAEEAYRYRSEFAPEKVLSSTKGFQNANANLYYNLHWDDIFPVNIVRRAGPLQELPQELNPGIGEVKVQTMQGELTLDELLTSVTSRAQGFIVLQDGKIVYERYPGMNENDHHIWFSASKTLPATIINILEAQGKIDVSNPIDAYVAETRGTNWEGIPIIDILDMASGLDLAETGDTMLNPEHKVNQYFQLNLGGRVESNDPDNPGPLASKDVLLSIDDKEDVLPGTIFEYSSLNTKMLVFLVEAVTGRRFTEVLSDLVWSVIGAEGDAFVATPSGSGVAESGGQMNSRLRDLARYGYIFTPKWQEENVGVMTEKWGLDEPISLVDKVYACRPALYDRLRELAEAGGGSFFGPPVPDVRCNSRQWDLVWEDGDIYKGGVGGQGLYVSPARNIVVAFFSTGQGGLTQYARAIAQELVPDP